MSFITNIEERTLASEYFREVLFTAESMQLVVMTLQVGEEIGAETHADVDKFIRIEAGTGRAILDGEETELSDGVVVVIPAGSAHNIVNTSATDPLKRCAIYSPPQHPDGTVNKSRADAMAYEAEHHH